MRPASSQPNHFPTSEQRHIGDQAFNTWALGRHSRSTPQHPVTFNKLFCLYILSDVYSKDKRNYEKKFYNLLSVFIVVLLILVLKLFYGYFNLLLLHFMYSYFIHFKEKNENIKQIKRV